MKPDPASSGKLKSEIRDYHAQSGLSYSEIGRIARVDPSQVSRICRGEFKTLSHNVVQVCRVLRLDLEMVKLETPVDDVFRQRLGNSVLDLWDRTPEDADRLVRLLRQLSDLRSTGRDRPAAE